MSAEILLRSFAGGVITPEMFGRIDLGKYQTGLQQAENFVILPHGPATRRPGTTAVLEARDSTHQVRTIPFSFSADQTVVLEFGHQYVRFHIAGATLLEAPKACVAGAVVTCAAHGYAVGDWVYMGGRFYIVATTPTGGTFTVTDLFGAAAVPAGTTVARVYTVATPYDSADLFDLHYAQSADVLTITSEKYQTRELRRLGAANWQLTVVSFAPTLAAPGGVGVAPTIAVATNLSPQSYVVTAIGADGVTESVASAIVSTSNNLTLAGNYNTVSWGAVAGATRYNVYKRRGGLYGFMGQTTATSMVDDNVTPDTTKTPPENVITLNAAVDDYPAAVTYHEQRRWFAGTKNKPQTIWSTRIGTESNLTSSVPSQASDGIEYRFAAVQQNRVRHLVPLADLLMLTAAGEWRIFADGAPAITPDSMSVKPQGYSGASNVQPVVTSGSILYVQAQGSYMRELSYGGEAANYSYRSIDMSIMATHLFNGYTIRDLAYSRAPDQVAWAVRSDGTLLGLTYVPEQQVYAWHHHVTTGGTFESVAVVAEGSEDVLYAVVRRTINGRTARHIERFHTRQFKLLRDVFHVDCGATYTGAPTTTVSGLWHLEGAEVDILADGAVEPRQTVTGGAVTLSGPASVVHVGLPMRSRLMTLPLVLDGAAAAGQDTVKSVQATALRISGSPVFSAGSSFDTLVPNAERDVDDPFDSPPALRRYMTELTIDGDWETDTPVCVEQDQPLPLTVLSMTVKVQLGG